MTDSAHRRGVFFCVFLEHFLSLPPSLPLACPDATKSPTALFSANVSLSPSLFISLSLYLSLSRKLTAAACVSAVCGVACCLGLGAARRGGCAGEFGKVIEAEAFRNGSELPLVLNLVLEVTASSAASGRRYRRQAAFPPNAQHHTARLPRSPSTLVSYHVACTTIYCCCAIEAVS